MNQIKYLSTYPKSYYKSNSTLGYLVVAQQLQSAGSPPYTRAPPDQYQNTNNNWNETLNSNKAGAASNAEDFTKQFMSDMFGGGKRQNVIIFFTINQK